MKLIVIIGIVVIFFTIFSDRIIPGTTKTLKVDYPVFSYKKHPNEKNKLIELFYYSGNLYTGKVFFFHGSYEEEGVFKDGLREGIWIRKIKHINWLSFFAEGTYYSEITFKNGVEDGPYRRYYKKKLGKMMLTGEGNYIEGRKEGIWKVYCHGKLTSEVNYKRNKLDGEKKNYDFNEKLISIEFYKEGQLVTIVRY